MRNDLKELFNCRHLHPVLLIPQHHFHVKRYFREEGCVFFSEGTKTFWQCVMRPCLFFHHDKTLQQTHKSHKNRLDLYQENNCLFYWKTCRKSSVAKNDSLWPSTVTVILRSTQLPHMLEQINENIFLLNWKHRPHSLRIINWNFFHRELRYYFFFLSKNQIQVI